MVEDRGRGVHQRMDAARTLAAGLVVVSHVVDLLVDTRAANPGPIGGVLIGIAGYGHAAVIVFFVLSGYWIAGSVVRRDTRPDFWPDYLIDRLSRLWTVLVPTLLLGGVCDAVGIGVVAAPVYSGALGTDSIAGVTLASLSPSVLFANLAFLQGIRFPAFGSNGPLWSLAFEFWFYVWFAALWLTLRRRRPSPALAAFLLVGVYPGLVWGFASWLCGAALYGVTRRLGRVDRRVAIAVLAVGVATTIAVVAVMGHDRDRRLDPLLALGVATILLGLFLVDVRPSPRGAWPWLARYGAQSSFSLYATHYPIAALSIGLLTRHGRWPATVWSAAAVIASVALLMAFARGFSRLTEAHTDAVRQRMRAGWRHVAIREWRSGRG